MAGGAIQVRVHSLLAPHSRPLVQLSVRTTTSDSASSPIAPAGGQQEAQPQAAFAAAEPPAATDACLVLDALGKNLYALGTVPVRTIKSSVCTILYSRLSFMKL